MRRGSRGRRLLLLITYIVASLAILAGTAIAVFRLHSSREALDTRLAEASDILTTGTLILAVVAGFVALQAFAVATGLPKIQMQLWFASSDKNKPIFLATKMSNGWLQTSHPADQTRGRIRLRNRSSYPAQNITVCIELNGMALIAASFHDTDTWWAVDFVDDTGVTAVQWDGGSDFLVHGHSARRLPDLDLGVIIRTGEAKNSFLQVRILASPGYERVINVPVVFAEEGLGSHSLEYMASIQSTDWL
jgi:hypothetical protein